MVALAGLAVLLLGGFALDLLETAPDASREVAVCL
jgi:hypothetical protein